MLLEMGKGITIGAMPRFLRAESAAKFLRLSVRQFYREALLQNVKGIPFGPRTLLYRSSDLVLMKRHL